MPTNAALDFGYPWWLTYGHLAVAVPTLALFALGWTRAWSKWPLTLLGLLSTWSVTAFLLMSFGFNINSVPPLPTQSFLRTGTGRVLDLGAGTGRSSIMVLTARPQATIVASDQFGDSFDHHFGHSETPQQRLQQNLQAAGVANRATIATADMRQLPFETASFDGIVSAYAVDHLNRAGIDKALAESYRVLKPGGDFLLILVANDRFAKFAFGPMLTHGGTKGLRWWEDVAKVAGFQATETGTSPVTQYLLLHRP